MGLYSSPAALFSAKAERFEKDGNLHWALAKTGQGGYHYAKARFCYDQAAANKSRAEEAAAIGATFAKRR